MSLQVASLADCRWIVGGDDQVYEVEIPQIIQAVESVFPHVPDQRKCDCPLLGTHRAANERAANRGGELIWQKTVPANVDVKLPYCSFSAEPQGIWSCRTRAETRV
jgi:hypothetical protein